MQLSLLPVRVFHSLSETRQFLIANSSLFLLLNTTGMRSNIRLILFTLLLVIIATACKYFFGPDLAWSGFSPVLAIALFSGFVIKDRDMVFLLPLLALFLSDAAIQLLYSKGLFPYAGFYDGQWKNYALILTATLIGWALKGRNYSSLAFGAIASPTVYFLASNYLVWRATTEAAYPKTFSGLLACYEAGLPFYRNSIIATLIFLPLTLVAYNYLTRNRVELRLA
jgi:hypothetical protein